MVKHFISKEGINFLDDLVERFYKPYEIREPRIPKSHKNISRLEIYEIINDMYDEGITLELLRGINSGEYLNKVGEKLGNIIEKYNVELVVSIGRDACRVPSCVLSTVFPISSNSLWSSGVMEYVQQVFYQNYKSREQLAQEFTKIAENMIDSNPYFKNTNFKIYNIVEKLNVDTILIFDIGLRGTHMYLVYSALLYTLNSENSDVEFVLCIGSTSSDYEHLFDICLGLEREDILKHVEGIKHPIIQFDGMFGERNINDLKNYDIPTLVNNIGIENTLQGEATPEQFLQNLDKYLCPK